MTTMTWNPSASGDASALSNGNLTITGATGGGQWITTLSTLSFSTGQYYLETTITANQTLQYGGWTIGVCNTSQSQIDFPGAVTSSGLGYFPLNGGILPGTTTIETGAVGSTVCVAYDFSAKLIWFRVGSGLWNNSSSANPATGTGGISFSAITGPYYTVFSWEQDNPPYGATTTNFGASTFGYTVPSGFSGFPSGGGVASISVSPATVAAGSANTVLTVTGVSTAFNGTSLSITGGLGSLLLSQTSTSGTAATATINAGLAGNTLTLTDSLSAATATVVVNPPSLGSLNIGFIGDSITMGTNGNPVAQTAAYLTSLGYTVSTDNQGINGSSSSDWLTALAGAMASFKSIGVTIVQIMLGTNDVRTPNSLTPAQHFNNMKTIVNTLVAGGYKVVIHKPPFTIPNVAINGDRWPNDPNSLYQQYFVLDMQLVNGTTVFQGDTAAFALSALTPTSFLAADGVHPLNVTENNQLGNFWGVAIGQRFGTAGSAALKARWTHF